MSTELPAWQTYCTRMKKKYPIITDEMRAETDFVDAHVFIDELSHQLTADDVIVPESSGGAGEITYQALRVKYGQKVKNAAGLGSMGFGVPYAMGSVPVSQMENAVPSSSMGTVHSSSTYRSWRPSHNADCRSRCSSG